MESIDPKHTNPKRRVIKTNGSPPKAPVAFVVGERISKGDAIQRVNRESSKKAASIRKTEKNNQSRSWAPEIINSRGAQIRSTLQFRNSQTPAANPIQPPKNAVERVARALGADDGTSGRHGSPVVHGGAPGLGRRGK
jgi:hypothetical protein